MTRRQDLSNSCSPRYCKYPLQSYHNIQVFQHRILTLTTSFSQAQTLTDILYNVAFQSSLIKLSENNQINVDIQRQLQPAVTMWMRCLCLLLLCQQALNIQIISREVSEASLDINTKPFHHVSGPAKCLSLKDKTKSDSCLVERCTEQCLVREQNNKQQVRLDFIITKS